MCIVATADLHGHLPQIAPCDVLVVAGDILPIQDERGDRALGWAYRHLGDWLEYVPAREVIGIGGNHDFAFEQRMFHDLLRLRWTYLQDSGCEIDGIRFWGVPWTVMEGWAFAATDTDDLRTRYERTPMDTDVLISHGPPEGHLDGGYHSGSRAVNETLQRVEPRLFICGHCHESYGIERGYRKTTDIYNVAHCDITYHPVNPPRVIVLD